MVLITDSYYSLFPPSFTRCFCHLNVQIGRCRATSVFAILQQPNLADLDLAEVLTPLKELLGTVFITLYEVYFELDAFFSWDTIRGRSHSQFFCQR